MFEAPDGSVWDLRTQQQAFAAPEQDVDEFARYDLSEPEQGHYWTIPTPGGEPVYRKAPGFTKPTGKPTRFAPQTFHNPQSGEQVMLNSHEALDGLGEGWINGPLPSAPDTSRRDAQYELVGSTLGDVRSLVDRHGSAAVGLGSLTSAIPGSPASNMSSLLATLQGFASFETLNAMRAASKTGGALGQVSERELAMLQSQFGALAQTQSPAQFKRELDKYENMMDTVINGGPAVPIGSAPDFSGVSAAPDFSSMSDNDFSAVGARLFGG